MKKENLNIVIIGSGNVATHLAKALFNEKYNILQIFSKNLTNAKALAKLVNSESTNKIKSINPKGDIYIFAIKDDTIPEVCKYLYLKDKVVIHTSGSVDMKVLEKVSTNIGVLYPVQTLSKSKNIIFKNVPICIEANNKKTYTTISTIAKSVSKSVYKLNSTQRKHLHLAAVFACNFTNYFYSVSEDILKQNNIPFDLLKPLIFETANQINSNFPSEMQTGPAKRKDKKIIKEHLNLLKSNNNYKKAYALISKLIIKREKK